MKNFDAREIKKKLNSFQNEVFSDSFLNKVGKYCEDKIRVRTRLGKSCDSNDNESKLAPLSSIYVSYRATFPGLYAETRVKKSNLTLTGHMLNSITWMRKSNGIWLFFADDFAEQKARWAHEGSFKPNRPKRPFFYLGTPLKTWVGNELRRQIDKWLSF